MTKWVRQLVGYLPFSIVLLPAPAIGQSFPAKPIRYVVPFAPGTSPDILGRLVGEQLAALWGQPVIVENRTGVAGALGAAFVAKSAPDGYTLLQCSTGPNAIAASLFDKLPYDQLRDFTPISRIGQLPNVLATHPSVSIRSVKDLIAYAKAHPGELSYASGQVGTSVQLSMELLKLMTKIDLVNIPYKVGSQSMSDTIGGQIPIGIFQLPSTLGPVRSERLRALAVTSAKRAPQFPTVPTMQEAGVPGYEVNAWSGVCAPAGIPVPLAEKLNADLISVLQKPEFQRRLMDVVTEVTPSGREAFDKFIRAEIVLWAKVIREAAIPKQ